MNISWLVFSDLHFSYKNFETTELRDKLPEFLKKEKISADFILVAGDCFYQLSKNISDEEITSVSNYIHKLSTESACSGNHQVYIVPGNHDVIRSKDRLDLLRSYTGYDYDSGNYNKNGDKLKDITNESVSILGGEFYFSKFNKLHQQVTGQECKWLHKLFEEDNYRILNINTCLLSGGYYTGNDKVKKDKHYDEGSLSIKDDVFYGECKKIKKDKKLNIAFLHHGIDYLRKDEQAQIVHLLEENNIDIVFSGHSHKIGIEFLPYNKNKLRQFTCGAPISDDYSEPSFYHCSFDTELYELKVKLFSYSKTNHDWELSKNQLVDFEDGIYSFKPNRFNVSHKNITCINNKQNLSEKIDTRYDKYFDNFGIVNALPYKEFIRLRNRLLRNATGDIIIVGQSLWNAFDTRADSESIVTILKENKNIKNIDVFLTDPIVYDEADDYGVPQTPIDRITITMSTILNDLAYSLSNDQSINIYFVPLVQLDHIVFVGDTLLIRHTLLWTKNEEFKATPLICKEKCEGDLDDTKISMYHVYSEYIKKLKDVSFKIDIKESGYNVEKETLAKRSHRKWRHELYVLRNSGRLKGNIIMHKLYRKQLISALHSSWSPELGSYSCETNWRDSSEARYFVPGENIKSHAELYDSKNLLNDSTQTILLKYVSDTERMLDALVKKYDKDAFAKIFPSLDIGVPNNILRLAGGFATGMLVVWKCGTPIVPVDTTVNVCSSSYYRLDSAVLKNKNIKDFFNVEKINAIINEGSKREGIAFSFNTGNHFLLLCKSKKSGSYYLVLHSSAKQFKDTYLGLYPKPGNWYSSYIKTYADEKTGKYINYLKDEEAERFIKIARMLNQENEDIHNWFASKFIGSELTSVIHKTYHHYGMPTDYSIAIGTFVIDENDTVPIFSREGYPICLFKPNDKMCSIILEGKRKYIVPHGWGQRIRNESLGLTDEQMSKSSLSNFNGKLLLKGPNKEILKEFDVDYKNRFPEDMVEVRKLWSQLDNNMDILKYSKYLSGEITDVLYPIALFSKGNDDVKYYE